MACVSFKLELKTVYCHAASNNDPCWSVTQRNWKDLVMALRIQVAAKFGNNEKVEGQIGHLNNTIVPNVTWTGNSEGGGTFSKLRSLIWLNCKKLRIWFSSKTQWSYSLRARVVRGVWWSSRGLIDGVASAWRGTQNICTWGVCEQWMAAGCGVKKRRPKGWGRVYVVGHLGEWLYLRNKDQFRTQKERNKHQLNQ